MYWEPCSSRWNYIKVLLFLCSIVINVTCDLDRPAVVNDAVGRGQATVDKAVDVQKVNATCYVGGEGESEWPTEWDVGVSENTVETAFGTVLHQDATVGWRHARSDEATDVDVVQFSVTINTLLHLGKDTTYV